MLEVFNLEVGDVVMFVGGDVAIVVAEDDSYDSYYMHTLLVSSNPNRPGRMIVRRKRTWKEGMYHDVIAQIVTSRRTYTYQRKLYGAQ